MNDEKYMKAIKPLLIKSLKLILVCVLCAGVVTALVLLVKWIIK